jgi:CRP/FNR family transcriptional regulator, cyclic AMP receptor protein
MTPTDDLTTMLGKVDLFADLPPKVLSRFQQDGARHMYTAGDEVTHEGDKVSEFVPFSQEGVNFHVVLAGSGEVRRDGAAIAQVGPGDYFGELSLIDGGPRTADVVAGPDGLETFALTKWTFADLLQDHPEVAISMLKVVTARLRRCEAAQRGSG